MSTFVPVPRPADRTEAVRLRIALVGTRGVPARYGGFETCVEEVGARLAERGHGVVVYCRRRADEPTPPSSYRGMDLVHLPAVRSRSLETLSHTGVSVAHLIGRPVDAAILFNAANAPYLPLLRARGIPVATHVDGLEWQRAKWGRSGQRYYRQAEALAVRWSDALIADAVGIQDYYTERFGVDTDLIAYGAPLTPGGGDPARLAELGLSSRGYHLVVARFEPENHVEVIVEGYRNSDARQPLIVVGSAPYADAYTQLVHSRADDRVRFLGGVWDQDLLDQLYAGATTYLHGHSVGGTNPSLLRAIGARAAVGAFDVSFNREVLADTGRYWRTPAEVADIVLEAERFADRTRQRGEEAGRRAALYDWDDVADRYEDLCQRLAGMSTSTGRRRPTAVPGAGGQTATSATGRPTDSAQRG